MATKYDLPQFRTPTQQYKRMPIVRTPNYGEIYAKSFLAGQQMSREAFAPLLNALKEQRIKREKRDKEVDTFEEQLDANIETIFSGTSTLDQKNRELYSKKADMLAEAKRKSLENPGEFKGEYESLFKTFKDELRNSSASTKNIELLVKALEDEENISNFQNNTFLLALKDEFIENQGEGITYRINENGKDELYFKDAYGKDIVLTNEFLANTDLVNLIQTKADFSQNGAERQLFQTLSEEFNTTGTIGTPNARAEVVNVKEGVKATTGGIVYSEAQKDNIKSSLLTDKKFQEIYADGSIAKSKFVHDWILTDNSTETLSIAREKIKAMAKASGVELNEFSDQMIETLLFTYGIEIPEIMTEEEQILMDSIDGYIDSQIADYFYKEFYAPNERKEQTSIEVTPVEDKEDDPIKNASGNTLALLNNLDTNGGIIDQIAKFHSLVETMGPYETEDGSIDAGGRGRLNEYIVEQFGFDLPSEARFDNIGDKIPSSVRSTSDPDAFQTVYEEYQYYINDLMVSSKDDYYENAYKFFKFKGSDLTRNQVKTLLELHAAKTALPQIGLRNEYNEYRDKILNNARNKYINAGGDVDALLAEFEKKRLENFRD